MSSDAARLTALINRWREDGMVGVRSCDIIPDATNRERTGLSLEHVHFLATTFAKEGFRKRINNEGHDIPVLVRENLTTGHGKVSFEKWKQITADTEGFPPTRISDATPEFFCSLGNGHFSQALNLFRNDSRSIFTGELYSVGKDDNLRQALDEGVSSIVLGCTMPLHDRKFVSEMLNRTHDDVTWSVADDGNVHITTLTGDRKTPQWEALSKVCDAEQLSCLIRSKLGVDYSSVENGYYLIKSKL